MTDEMMDHGLSAKNLQVAFEDKYKQENDLMLTILELVKNGANPTIKSASGQRPKRLALIAGFDLGVLLLGKTSNSVMT